MKPLAIALGLVILFSGTVASAETIYISDQLEASLRRGEGTKYQILRMLKSGEPLELIEYNRETGYTKVRTSSGTEGYVLSRYLMDEPASREQLSSLKENNQELRGIIVDLENRISELENISNSQSGEITQLQSEKQTLDTELTEIREATADVITIKRSNRTLTDQVDQLTAEKTQLQTENNEYRSKTKQDWFVRGAGVVLLGVLIGLILPKLRRRKRWGEL